jgi:nitroreductase
MLMAAFPGRSIVESVEARTGPQHAAEVGAGKRSGVARLARRAKKLGRWLRRKTAACRQALDPSGWWGLRSNFSYDFRRFFAFSSAYRSSGDPERSRALITMDYHRLEKAMALPAPRANFGEQQAFRLLRNLERHVAEAGIDEESRVAYVVLLRYDEYRRRRGKENSELARGIRELHPALEDRRRGGTLTVLRDDIQRAAKQDLTDFFETRHSVRQFSEQEVDVDLIHQAVRMAQRAPSVCNRQSARVHVIQDQELKIAALECQNGNLGFRHDIDKVLIITSDLSAFVSAGERNQCWIDGGLFAMSLIYGMHSLGLGTCCLNWSVEKEQDQRLRRAIDIPEHEAVIMMIAVGHLPEQLEVAASPRKPTDEVMRIL